MTPLEALTPIATPSPSARSNASIRSPSWVSPNWTALRLFESKSHCVNRLCLIAALIFSTSYYSAIFFTNQRIWIVLGSYLFWDLFTHFHAFWSQIEVMLLVTPIQEVEREIKCFYDAIFFWLWFQSGVRKRSLNEIFTFLTSGFFIVHMRYFYIEFYYFFIFLSDYFLNRFLNPFIVHSLSSFLFSQWEVCQDLSCISLFFLVFSKFQTQSTVYDRLKMIFFFRFCTISWIFKINRKRCQMT